MQMRGNPIQKQAVQCSQFSSQQKLPHENSSAPSTGSFQSDSKPSGTSRRWKFEVQIRFLSNCKHTHRATESQCLGKKLTHLSLATPLIQMHSFMIKRFDRLAAGQKPSSSITFTPLSSVNFSANRVFIPSAFHNASSCTFTMSTVQLKST